MLVEISVEVLHTADFYGILRKHVKALKVIQIPVTLRTKLTFSEPRQKFNVYILWWVLKIPDLASTISCVTSVKYEASLKCMDNIHFFSESLGINSYSYRTFWLRCGSYECQASPLLWLFYVSQCTLGRLCTDDSEPNRNMVFPPHGRNVMLRVWHVSVSHPLARI